MKPDSVTNPNNSRKDWFGSKWNRKSNFQSQNPDSGWLKRTQPQTGKRANGTSDHTPFTVSK